MNIILCGKSGSGKDFARNYIIETYGFTPIISHTSRPIREGEINGKDYHFISDQEFIEKALHNYFLKKIPVRQTILQATDIKDFLLFQKVWNF